jgi:hypothetical protein
MRHNYTRCNYSSSLVNFTIERFAAAAASISARQRLMNSKANYQFWFFFLFFLHKPAHFCRTMWINILSSPSLFSLPAHRVPRNLEMNIILRLSFFVSRPEVQWFLRGPANGSNYQCCDLMKDASACLHVVYLCVTRNAYTIRIYPAAFFFSPGYSSLFFLSRENKTNGKHVYTAPSLRKNNEKII